MTDITIPDAAVEAAARNMFYLRATEPDQSVPCRDTDWDSLPDSWQEEWRDGARAALAAAAPFIAAQERQRVADEIDLPAVMAHLLRGSRDDLILADRINVAIGASRVRRIEAGNG